MVATRIVWAQAGNITMWPTDSWPDSNENLLKKFANNWSMTILTFYKGGS